MKIIKHILKYFGKVEWKQVVCNVELKYYTEINKNGEIRKNVDGDIKYYKPGVNSRGYKHVSLVGADNKRYNLTMHRLICATFLGNQPDKVINHIDGNRLNNSLNNLEWVSRKQNSMHAKSISQFKRVKQLDETEISDIITEYLNSKLPLKDLAEKWNITRETLRTIINKKAKNILSDEEYSKLRKKHIENKIVC